MKKKKTYDISKQIAEGIKLYYDKEDNLNKPFFSITTFRMLFSVIYDFAGIVFLFVAIFFLHCIFIVNQHLLLAISLLILSSFLCLVSFIFGHELRTCNEKYIFVITGTSISLISLLLSFISLFLK